MVFGVVCVEVSRKLPKIPIFWEKILLHGDENFEMFLHRCRHPPKNIPECNILFTFFFSASIKFNESCIPNHIIIISYFCNLNSKFIIIHKIIISFIIFRKKSYDRGFYSERFFTERFFLGFRKNPMTE